MRKELQEIATLEEFLIGKLQPTEHAAMELALKNNSSLQQKLSFQEELMLGIERVGLKANAGSAYKAYLFRKKLLWMSIIVGIILIGLAILIQLNANQPVENSEFQTTAESFVETEALPQVRSYKYLNEEVTSKTENDSLDYAVDSILEGERIIENEQDNFPVINKDSELTPSFNPSESLIPQALNTTDDIENSPELEASNIPENVAISTLNFLPPQLEDFKKWVAENGEIYTDEMYYNLPVTNKGYNYDIVSYNNQESIISDAVKNERQLEKELIASRQNNGTILRLAVNQRYFKSYKKKKKYALKETEPSFDYLVWDTLINEFKVPTTNGTKWPFNSFDEQNIELNEWDISTMRVGDSLVDIVFEFRQRNHCYIYGLKENEGYNMPTQFLWREEQGAFTKIGNVKEYGVTTQSREPRYKIKQPADYGRGKSVKFVQRIRLNQLETTIKVNYAYMLCNYGMSTKAPREDSVLININLNAPEQVYGINPLAIKILKNSAFNNTILATKAFEERMQFIHESCNMEILELYVINLDLELATIDLMAAKLASGDLQNTFELFASLGEGGIAISAQRKLELEAFYHNFLQNSTRKLEEEQTTTNLLVNRLQFIYPCLQQYKPEAVTNEAPLNEQVNVKANEGFSPDGDGIYDYYEVLLGKEYAAFKITISNKKERVVYQSEDQNFRWDGKTLEGKPAKEGSYFGVLELTDFDGKEFTVALTIMLTYPSFQ